MAVFKNRWAKKVRVGCFSANYQVIDDRRREVQQHGDSEGVREPSLDLFPVEQGMLKLDAHPAFAEGPADGVQKLACLLSPRFPSGIGGERVGHSD